jgi:hypothetical protein
MSSIPYTGTIIQSIFNNHPVGSSNPTIDLNFYNQPIDWNGTMPPSLSNYTRTLADIHSNPIFSVSYEVNIQITGSQYFNGWSNPTTSVSIGYSNINYPVIYTAGSCDGQDHGTCHYNVNNKFPFPGLPRTLNISVYNQCISPGCFWYPSPDYTFIFTLIIHLNANCSGKNFENSFCQNYCLINPLTCYYGYIDYCFPKNVEPSQMPIGSSVICQNFVENYIGTNGPRSEFDNGLTRYCTKYKNFGDLFNSNQTDQQLCACHMDPKLYEQFADELNKKYNGFENILINQCLVPKCISSPFKSETTHATCPLPACLNIVNFDNNGNFVNSCVDINQTGCTNITPKNGGNICGTQSLMWLWILLAILAFVFILIIIIILLVVVYKHKKKSSIPST